MGSTIPSTTTSQALSLAIKPLECSSKSWDDSSFRLNDCTQEEPKIAPRSMESNSTYIRDHNENNIGPQYESIPRLIGSSRHRASSSNNGGNKHTIRSSKHPSQKSMLSKALQKANTAVLLDNAQNFEVAKQAYSEACAILEYVMSRSSGDEDRRKLEAIRNTYLSRISELERISPHLIDNGKALPARPNVGLRKIDDIKSSNSEEEREKEKERALAANFIQMPNSDPIHFEQQCRTVMTSQLPPRRESLLQQGSDIPTNKSDQFRTGILKKIPKDFFNTRDFQIENHKLPSLNSPRHSISPQNQDNSKITHRKSSSVGSLGCELKNLSLSNDHSRISSGESISWLDTIDESERSTTPSIHSRTPSIKTRKKARQTPNVETEAEFDAALDAAVEAAYDDSLIPIDDFIEDEIVTTLKRRDEQTKQEVCQSEYETDARLAHNLERRQLQNRQLQNDILDDYYPNEFEEEDQIVEQVTKDYVTDLFEFGLQSKTILPRESDSSGFSGRTWISSIGSNPTTASTITSTTSRVCVSPQVPLQLNNSITAPPSPPLPPPQQALPSPPSPRNFGQPLSSFESTSSNGSGRRYSGHTNNKLQLESNMEHNTDQLEPSKVNEQKDSHQLTPALCKTIEHSHFSCQNSNTVPLRPPNLQLSSQITSSFSDTISSDIVSFTNSAPLQNSAYDINKSQQPLSPVSIQTRIGLRKNFSSSSLRNIKKRHVITSNYEEISDHSPATPLTKQSNGQAEANKIQSAVPSLPTPISALFREKQPGNQSVNMYSLNNDLNYPESPGSSSPPDSGGQISLEPCPAEYLLRPFWLMRALYQTIIHPKGGYISNKLFIPCDAWRVRGVKIKNVEDKITNCEVLTTALVKFSRVDTMDADAVLDEMQTLESVLEQVQASLSKKLGNEVGAQSFGSSGIFKENVTDGDSENNPGPPKPSNSSGKSSFSWRRLRSKNSGLGLSHSYSSKSTSEGKKESYKMTSLPMVSNSSMKIRFSKKDISQLQITGANSNYIIALARLFEAAQIIDQIARQVDDPGLRHADKTQVGLELSTRHAAEFFGFYICRFVLTDIALLLDKFVKKGGEWVLE